MKETKNKKLTKRRTDTKVISVRVGSKMLKRLKACEDSSEYIRQCIDRVIKGHINIDREVSQQMRRYIRGERLETVQFRAPGYMWKVIDEQEDRGCYIRGCILAQMELENPLERGTDNMERIMLNPQANENVKMVDEAIPCGPAVSVEGNMGEWTSLIDILGINPDEMYVMKAVGNSMIDAFVESGDFIVIHKGNHAPMPQELAVCELNGEFTLKHFFLYKDSGWLYPDNEEYEPIRVQQGEDILAFHGTVHRIIKNPKKNSHFDYDRCLKVMERQ